MRINKISVVFFVISVIFVILSFISINIYNDVKEMIILRDNEIINGLQVIVGDIKDNVTVESAIKVKVFSQKIMNMDVSFYKNNTNLSDYSIRMSDLSSDILKNINNEDLLVKLILEYENMLNAVSNILK